MSQNHSYRKLAFASLAALAVTATAACGGEGFDSGSEVQASAAGPVQLKVLIASSGDAETKAVTDAAAAWAKTSGNTVTVTPATDIKQQLGQGLAAGTPPDVFYVDAGAFADYASVGALEPYGDTFAEKDNFYPALRQSFTYQNKLYCIPKDFSTLALEINTEAWSKAGLTEADIPTTWDQLKAVATKLTNSDQVGLAIGDTRDRVGAFMVEAGGWVTNPDATAVTADSPQNLEAVDYLKSLLAAGVAKYPKQLDSGWAGEAFGKQKAAMTIEGNWIRGAMKNDFPAVKYTVVPLPAGPKGPGTLSFTQCWGVATKSANHAAAVSLVAALTTEKAQLGFAESFGVMPSRQSAQAAYVAAFPDDKPFIEGVAYAQGPVNAPKINQVLTDFDTALQGLPKANSKEILTRLQTNASAVIGK
ncbi:MAG TPA: extracellular solute-binding protein [Kineosporiaceae bacterium]|nr:extracellular solute-binding protein [Kineosporiaceae bacterium]